MSATFWLGTVAVLLLVAGAATLRELLQTRRANDRQRQLLIRQQEQLRLIRMKLNQVGKQLQAATQRAESASRAQQAMAAQNAAMKQAGPHRIRRQLALTDNELSKRIAATSSQRLKLELEEKRNAIRTIMQVLISSRLEAELASTAQAPALAAPHEDLVRRRVNEMFPKVLAEPYRS